MVHCRTASVWFIHFHFKSAIASHKLSSSTNVNKKNTNFTLTFTGWYSSTFKMDYSFIQIGLKLQFQSVRSNWQRSIDILWKEMRDFLRSTFCLFFFCYFSTCIHDSHSPLRRSVNRHRPGPPLLMSMLMLMYYLLLYYLVLYRISTKWLLVHQHKLQFRLWLKIDHDNDNDIIVRKFIWYDGKCIPALTRKRLTFYRTNGFLEDLSMQMLSLVWKNNNNTNNG